MDTVSSLPFELSFLTHHYKTSVKQCTDFTHIKAEAQSMETVQIQENDPSSILFYSQDPEAKLYLDALDTIPSGYQIITDARGRIYRQSSPEPFPLHKTDGNFDALRIDRFTIMITCEGKTYYGSLTVAPKQLDNTEWETMKDDLEKELRGLAMDAIRSNIGLGKKESADIPPEYLYKFLVMKKHSQRILQALIDIQTKPKHEVKKEYQKKPAIQSNIIDRLTIKRHLQKGNNQEFYIPHKVIDYDIPENRVLKKMLKYYEKELNTFLLMVSNSQRHYASIVENHQHKKTYLSTLAQYASTAEKLKHISNVIKQERWFKTVGDEKGGRISHSFALDSRYGAVYRMYRELKKEEIKVGIDSRYAYSWKKSSTLYEMWCYIKLCRLFEQSYETGGHILSQGFKDGMVIPFLEEGTKTTFIKGDIKLDILYNPTLGRSKASTDSAEQPYYMNNNHLTPDIIINIYYRPEKMYIGSIVLECKYRKLNSFWYGTTMSSKSQIMAYHTGAKSIYYHNMPHHDVRPVHKVFVLTPDKIKQDDQEDEIALRGFRPGDHEMQEGVLAEIQEIISQRTYIATQETYRLSR